MGEKKTTAMPPAVGPKDWLAFRMVYEAIEKLMSYDCGFWQIEGFVDEPKGNKQTCESPLFDHEYVEQSCGIIGDDFEGNVYLPLGNGEYIRIRYEC